MAYPDTASGDVFRRLEAHGFDFSVPHEVEFFVLFPDEQCADAVAKKYVVEHKEGKRLAKVETRSGRQGGMELIIAKEMFVTYDNVTQFEAELGKRAAAFGGRLDGWGVLQE